MKNTFLQTRHCTLHACNPCMPKAKKREWITCIKQMMMKGAGVMTMLVLALFLSFPTFAADKEKETAYERVMRTGTLKCGYYPWPPYFDVDPNTNEVTGMMADIANAVGELLDLKIEFVQLSALGMQPEELRRGKYDTFCVDSYYVFTSIKYVDFSDPALYVPVFVYVREEEERFQKFSDMNDSSISFVGIDGDISTILVERNFKNAMLSHLPSNSDGAQIMMNVLTKKADATITDPGIIKGFNENNNPGLKMLFPDQPVATYPIGFSVLKGEDKLRTMLNGALSALHNTNGMEPIIRHYDPERKTMYSVSKPYDVYQ